MTATAHRRTLHVRIYRGLERRLGVDARSLAAFRIALGSILVVDLLLRARNLRTFYTDAGVYPVAVLREASPTLSRFSLHALSGEARVQALLFGVAICCALALLAGYRTRLATAASLCLLVSLHIRNPYVLTGGDALLQHLLFWSLFLPLGARWSVDARRREAAGDRVFTVASVAILCQVLLVYGVNAILKLRSEAWLSGDAAAVVFGLDRFTVFLGPLLRDATTVLWLANWAWVGLLVAAPLLVVLTGWWRLAVVGAFATMHLGMLATMHLGIFPLVSIVALVPFLPGRLWDRLESREAARRLRTVGTGALDALDRTLPARPIAAVPARFARWRGPAVQAIAAAVLVGLVAFNAIALGFVPVPGPADGALDGEYSDSRWTMFAPNPPETDRWYVAPATLGPGEEVDAFRRSELRWERPDDITATYSTARERKYLSNLRWNEHLREPFAAYLCDRWKRTEEGELEAVSVYAVEAPSLTLDEDDRRRTELVRASCDP